MKKLAISLALLLAFSADRGQTATWNQPYIDGLTNQRSIKPLASDQKLSRSEFAILLEQTFLILPKVRRSGEFNDLPPTHWASRAIQNAYEAGFLSGTEGYIFPDRPMTRLEAMVSIANGLQLPVNPQKNRKANLKSQFLDGDRVPDFAVDPISALTEQKIWLTTPQSPQSLDLSRTITQGELAVLFYEVLVAQKQAPPIARQKITQVTRLEVSLSRRRVTAFRGDTKFKTYPIAVGRAGWETPKGTFNVKQQYEKPAWKNPFTGDVIRAGDPDNPLGQYWIGFWTNGKDWSGFHGTPNRGSVGQAVSHGCLRMYNEDIRELFGLISQETIVKVDR